MAEKVDEKTTSSNGEAWGTLEELLLACAVNRHGTTSWDSIATELRKRLSHSFVFSPHNCKQKYVDLNRRFRLSSSAVSAAAGGVATAGEADELVEELRKLRVEELRREVQRHDRSIVSLQSKVKRLEEEREKSLSKDEETQGGGSDLRIEPDGNAIRTEEKADDKSGRSSPEKFDSAEDRSFNESNSSSHNKISSGVAPEKKETERESISKQHKPEVKSEPCSVRKVEPVKESVSASRPGELGESVSESKREQQSSDVQSSASLSKKKRRRFRGGGSSGDELEAEEISPANKRISVKSRPLIRFLEILRSHKHGSVFKRRLPSQETEKYGNVIRQYMDLDMVQSRLDKGLYDDCRSKFYRDLLLIFTNAVFFYRKSSAEHLAARELRKLVTHEITQMTQTSEKIRPELETNHLELVVKKRRSSTTNMVVCRRRSANSMQALSESVRSDTKVENGRTEEKTKVDGDNSDSRQKEEVHEIENEKVVARERPTLRSGGLRLSNNNNRKIISKEAANKREKVESDQNLKLITDKGTSVSKKQGVANFLKRMEQNSPSSQEKGNNDNSEDDENEEDNKKERSVKTENVKKKKGGNLRKTTKDARVVVSRRISTRKGDSEEATHRKAGGRPPKRMVGMISSSTTESRKVGRSRDRDGDEKYKKRPRR